MPLIEWHLRSWPFEQTQTIAKIQIDPATICGGTGTFGAALFFPYVVVPPEGAIAPRLLSLEGWIGWNTEPEYNAKLHIPSQTVWPRDYRLQIPITQTQIEAIEQARCGGSINWHITLGGLAGEPIQQVQSASTGYVTVERERWLLILQQLGAGTIRLVELPEPRFQKNVQGWIECFRLLDGATRLFRSGDYEHAVDNCRQIVEGIIHVLSTAWNIPIRERGESPASWIRDREDALKLAWPEDRLTPGMLRTLITGAWQWLANEPHYGTGIPLREDASFVLGLCTDLLLFAGQMLQAHPNPIVP